MFLLFYDAKTKKVSALNGSGRAPASLTIAGLRKKGIKGDRIPMNDLMQLRFLVQQQDGSRPLKISAPRNYLLKKSLHQQ